MSTQAAGRPTDEAILALLHEAKEAGVPSVTRTGLVKYLYLLDYATAQELNGKTWTSVRWRFVHFGPFDGTVADAIDGLVARSAIAEQKSSSPKKDYYLYQLADWKEAKSLAELGVSAHARNTVANAIREYAQDLTALLRYVYSKTEPMVNASPGDVLDFSGCAKVDFRIFKPMPRKALDPKKVATVKALLENEYSKRYTATVSHALPRYDEVFALGLAALNAQDAPEDDLLAVSGVGRIDTEEFRSSR